MQKSCKLIICALIILAATSCKKDISIGKPIISLEFNNSLQNTGIVKTAIYGPPSVAYAFEKKDTCLDLSLTAVERQALSIRLKDNFSFNDYEGFTVACWVKKHPDDPEAYTILSHTQTDSTGTTGWQINTQQNGAWSWWFSDGIQSWNYKPTKQQQINNNQWHHLAFSYDENNEEARLYFDGINVACYSLYNNHFQLNNPFIVIGDKELSKESYNLFNGHIDDLLIWSRVIDAEAINAIFNQRIKKIRRSNKMDEQLKVMSWNISNGGQRDGRFVGLKRITEIIENENPDIVFIQESFNSGIKIADALGYAIYQRSDKLCVLSRFPFHQSHNIFNPENAGSIEINLGKEKFVVACPLFLSKEPDLTGYFMSAEANVDSIETWEAASRGKEARFLLSELSQLSKGADKKPMIVGGDFNSGSHLDWTARNMANNNDLSINFPTSIRFNKKGYIDSYRHLYPDESINFGYTNVAADTTFNNRSNFIYFKGSKLIATETYVVKEHPNGFPSENAAIITTFDWLED